MTTEYRNFVRGGPIQYDSPVYITRQDDEKKAFEALVSKKDVSIIGSRQIGKTSLLHKMQAQVATNYGHATAYLDLSILNVPDVDVELWAHEFSSYLLDQLKAYLITTEGLQPPRNAIEFGSYWRELSKRLSVPSALILLDEANSIPIRISDPFYSTIRSIASERASPQSNSSTKKIYFVFAGVFNPETDLVHNRENSPFNASSVIRLRDFNSNELADLVLAIGENIDGNTKDRLSDFVLKWTGGHPYLTQSMLYLVATKLAEDAQFKFSEHEEELIFELLDIASDNVDHLMRLVTREDALNKTTLRIVRGNSEGFSRARSIISRLELLGIIKNVQGKATIRNKLYEFAYRLATGIDSNDSDSGDKEGITSNQRDKFTNLSRQDRGQLINIIEKLNDFGTERGRIQLLKRAFGGTQQEKVILSRIQLDGVSSNAATELVDFLVNFGEADHEELALSIFLETLVAMIGNSKEKEFILKLLNGNNISE